MNDGSDLMMLAVVVVAFIAGYSIVSYVVRKLKPSQTPSNDPGQKGSTPTTEDSSDRK